MSKVTMFVGEFGSGKTELTVNYALQLKEQGQTVAVVDIDLVKPYFRTREHTDLLEERGIKVVAPDKRLSHADLPVPPSELTWILAEPDYQVVIDVGGGESAVALGQFRQRLMDLKPEVLLVVNTRRPFTSTKQGILETLHKIERVSGLTVTGLVANTNLGVNTTIAHVRDGLGIVKETAAELGLPLVFTVVPEWLKGENVEETALFVLRPITHYPWMD